MSYRDYTPGIRLAVTWLHKRANEMNDPKAKQILDSAAFSLGQFHAAGLPRDTTTDLVPVVSKAPS